jgi:hypothetical protein
LWGLLKDILDNGASFPLSSLDEALRREDLTFHQTRGNHKSTLKFNSELKKAITKDNIHGFTLPLPFEVLHCIPNTSLAQLGCVRQDTIDEWGNKSEKFRLTHDQTFPGPSGLSVNLRVMKDKLPLIMYSFALLKIIHYIVNLRHHLPDRKIFICKVDLDVAYRRCSLSSSTAMECLTIFDGLLLMALRMMFGGAPCPSIWGVISESMADLGNALLQNPLWDHNMLYNPVTSDLGFPISLDDSIPFHQAADLSVSVPYNVKGKIDIYIDDFIGVAPDIANSVSGVSQAIPLAV